MRPTARPIDTNPWGIETGYGVALTLFPGAPEFEFEIQRAPDVSGAPDEPSAETVARVALGNGTWVDPLPNDGAQRWYRYRHVRDGFEPSPWTCWVAGTPREVGMLLAPAAPIVPRLTEDAAVSGSTGTLTLTPTDPQCRVSKVEFRTKVFGGSWSAFAEDSAMPYTASVDVTDGTGYIGYRVTIYDGDGTVRTLESTLAFGSGGAVSTVSILECQARITGATKTTVTVTVDVIGPSDAQVSFESVTGATKASGPNVGVASPSGTVWIFNRPAFQAGTGQARFRAFDAGYQDDQDQAWIEEQGRDTVALLVKCSPLPSTDPTEMKVRVRVMDPIPTGAIALTYEAEGVGGVTPASPATVSGVTNNIDTTGFVDFTITLPPERSGPGRVTFQATLSGRTTDSDSVDVPALPPSIGPQAHIDLVAGAPTNFQRVSLTADQGVGPYEWRTRLVQVLPSTVDPGWPATWESTALPETMDIDVSTKAWVLYLQVRDANQTIGETHLSLVPPPRFENTGGTVGDNQLSSNVPLLVQGLPQVWAGVNAVSGLADTSLLDEIAGDGSTNDTAALQALIDAVGEAGGGTIYLPARTYSVTQLKLRSRVTLAGAGWGTAIVQRAGSKVGASTPLHLVILADGTVQQTVLRNLRLDGNAAAQTTVNHGVFYDQTGGTGSWSTNDQHHLLQDLWIDHVAGTGVMRGPSVREMRILNVNATRCNEYGFSVTVSGGTDNFFGFCTASACGYSGFNANGYNERYLGCKAFGNGTRGIGGNQAGFLVSGLWVKLTNCQAEENSGRGFHFLNTQACVGAGLVADANADDGFLFDNSFDCSVQGSAHSPGGAVPVLAHRQPWAFRIINGSDRNNINITAPPGEHTNGIFDDLGVLQNDIKTGGRQIGRAWRSWGDVGDTNEHFAWGKNAAPAAGNPQFALKTTPDATPVATLEGYDGTTNHTFLRFDHVTGRVYLGAPGDVTPYVDNHLLPTQATLHDLGSSPLSFRNVYARSFVGAPGGSVLVQGPADSIFGTKGGTTDEHFHWGKAGAPANGNPRWMLKTNNAAVPSSSLTSWDGTTEREYLKLDPAGALLVLGSANVSLTLANHLIPSTSGTFDLGSFNGGNPIRLRNFFGTAIDLTGTADIANRIASQYGTKGSTANEHLRFGKAGSGATGNPYFNLSTDDGATPVASLQSWDGTTARTFLKLDHAGARLVLGDVGGVGVTVDGLIRSENGGKYLEMGSQNVNYAHYYTDALVGHFFNKEVRADGPVRPWTDNTRQLGASSLRWTAVYAVNGTIQTSQRAAKQVDATLRTGNPTRSRSASRALDLARNLPVYRFRYLDPEGHIPEDAPQHVGVMLDELPDWAKTTEEGINYASIASLALAAVAELAEELDTLRARLPPVGAQ